MDTKKVIAFWYDALSFPEEYRPEFEQALETITIPEDLTIEAYDFNEQDGKKNLLSFLYFCEALQEKYDKKGISRDILYDTLSDIVVWTKLWSELKGELFLGKEIAWLKNHFEMKLFKLGRLQFCMGKAEHDAPFAGLTRGDDVLELHIPATGPLSIEECLASVERSDVFFKEFYPEHQYRCITCFTWLLDPSLKEMLAETSNIIRFQDMVEVVCSEPSDAILRYVCRWDATRENIKDIPCSSSFAQKVKEKALAGHEFCEMYGVLKRG